MNGSFAARLLAAVLLLGAGYLAARATADLQAVEVLPTAEAERLARGARWRPVSQPTPTWRCRVHEDPMPDHGGTTTTSCPLRVGVVALRWTDITYITRYSGYHESSVTLDGAAQRHFLRSARRWSCGSRDDSSVPSPPPHELHVGDVDGEAVVRCVMYTPISRAPIVQTVALRPRPVRRVWAVAIAVARAALAYGLALLVRRGPAGRAPWRVARRAADGAWRLADGSEVAVAGVDGDEALVVLGDEGGGAPYRDNRQVPSRVATRASLAAERAREFAQRLGRIVGSAGFAALAAAAAWTLR